MGEIVTKEGFERWLIDQPDVSGATLAVRAALRAYPVLVDYLLETDDALELRFFLTQFAVNIDRGCLYGWKQQ